MMVNFIYCRELESIVKFQVDKALNPNLSGLWFFEKHKPQRVGFILISKGFGKCQSLFLRLYGMAINTLIFFYF